MKISPEKIRLDTIKNLYQQYGVDVDVLRLDLIHPVISGNKWFKLKRWLEIAKEENKKTIATFGGAWSNHIVATAAACEENGFVSVGLIRGEKPAVLSETLKQAAAYGMELIFLPREAYKNKQYPSGVSEKYPDAFVIPEGGYGEPGAEGAEEILSQVNVDDYTQIVAAVGTGTMLAGLVRASTIVQLMTGISVMKNNQSLQEAVNALLPENRKNSFQIVHDFHFGGYAKHNKELTAFMNDFYQETSIPSDIVYTGKLFYVVDRLIREGRFSAGSKLLVIHSGGLQGNRSLPQGTLIF